MSKYECTCGLKLSTKTKVNIHLSHVQSLQAASPTYNFTEKHRISKNEYVSRFFDTMKEFNPLLLLSFGAGITLNVLFISRAGFSFWETLLECFCAGIVIARIMDK